MDLATNEQFQDLKARMIRDFIRLPGNFDLEAFGFKGWETDEPPKKMQAKIEGMSDEKAFECMMTIVGWEFPVVV